MTKNPLLEKNLSPKFNKISPKHFKPAMVKIINTHRATIKKLLIQKKFTWHNFVEPLAIINEQLHTVWTTICHLNAVAGTKEVRTAYEKCLPLVTKYLAQLSQDNKTYQAFSYLRKEQEFNLLDNVQKKIINDKLRDFSLAGALLSRKHKLLFIKLNQRLATLSNKFSYNTLDASQNCLLALNTKQTHGLPDHILALGRSNAHKKKQKGWLFRLDQPSYQALITFANSRSLRKKIYTAYTTRASDVNKAHHNWDNTKIMIEILKIRAQLARLVAFNNYAEYSLATKMAKNTQEVLDFLNHLAKQSLPKAKKELIEFKQFAKTQGIKQLKPWDFAYYEEKLSQKKFNLSPKDLRTYFPEKQVINGIFEIIKHGSSRC